LALSLTAETKKETMFLKLTSLLLLLCILHSGLRAQRFMQSAGASISIMHTHGSFDGFTQALDFVLTDLTYFPRLNISSTDHSSISIGLPVSVGVGFASDYQSNGKGVYWGFDLPLVADYNIGCKSTPENHNKFGGYFGTGFGFTYTNWNFNGSSSAQANSYGPMIRGGFRFGFPSSEISEGLTVGLFYKLGLEKEKYKTYGFSVLVDF
jgi:hypothetical protein